jgi:hypothetical protein
MSQQLTISDALFERLTETAHQRGLHTVEQLLEVWQAAEDELRRRRAAVEQADAVRERMAVRYGVQPDSVELVREDRAR